MKKAKVQLWQSPRGYATVEDGATKGATFGQNLWWPDGSLVKQSDFTNAGAPVQQGTPSQTLWSLVLQIPATVQALAAATGSGFYNSSGVFRDVAADEVTYDPTTSGLSSTDVQGAIDEIAAGGGSVPYFVASGDTYSVPENQQALFAMTIDCEGILAVDGYLIGVD